ncbi:MAG TPA: MOSC N-terminal beta barrel domain-containing protein [Thermoanaerobaculia bacterium]|jgi:uncharacterized protein YcbX|nr:MOSC N-terminal beta barrel domain-containing protein [Thermoanaerobaculia bacterium]
MIPIGRVHELARYPVKSMGGTTIESAQLGWHGIAGDRRFAFRRVGDSSAFPWLSASRLPELVRYQPVSPDEHTGEPLFTTVRTPAGGNVELRGAALQAEIAERLGSAVDLMELKHGIFDEASVSVISLTTIAAIGREVGTEIDRRRMRANVVLETHDSEPFLEDGWVGGTLLFGDGESSPAVSITGQDLRCVMINIDPDTGEKDARVMKAVVRLNGNNAGVYGTVVRRGPIHVGQTVSLVRSR